MGGDVSRGRSRVCGGGVTDVGQFGRLSHRGGHWTHGDEFLVLAGCPEGH